MAYRKKKDDLKRELARRLSVQREQFIKVTEILDRKEVAALLRRSENHFTNGLTDYLPNYYFADRTKFGPEGLMLYLRSDVDRRKTWENKRFDWPPESDEPTPDQIIKLLRGESPS